MSPAAVNAARSDVARACRPARRASVIRATSAPARRRAPNRHPEAAEQKARTRYCGSDHELAEALLGGLQLLLRLTNDSYGQRVLARLAEVLPEPLLPRLDAIATPRAPREATPQLKLVGG